MFLTQLRSRNPEFIETVLGLYRSGCIPPNSYVMDVDRIQQNAAAIAGEASNHNISLYFMSKQYGRNPIVNRAVVSAGIRKAVSVDPFEAVTLASQGVELGHVGHLVQIPQYYLTPLLRSAPEVVTVFSVEAAKDVSRAAREIGREQELLLRIVRQGDTVFESQEGGIRMDDLEAAAKAISSLPNVRIVGVTSFPCIVVKDGAAVETPNFATLLQATEVLRSVGIDVKQINAPSVTCASTLPMLAKAGATHGEPGHGLTGTTPLHAADGQVEVPSYLYITEVSHQADGYSYVYGGGYYRRGHLERALVGWDLHTSHEVEAVPLDAESIDYYLRIRGTFPRKTPVVLAFRTQIFVTRAWVVPITGVHEGQVEIAGIYTSQGERAQ